MTTSYHRRRYQRRAGRSYVWVVRYTIDLFGLTIEITELRQVEIEIKDGASLRDIVTELRRKIPTLEGIVIHGREDRLSENYVFNVNGRFYSGDEELRLLNGDRVALLTLATGG